MDSAFNRNLLQMIGPGYTWADYKTFKTYLRLPLPYLTLLFKNYAKPTDAVFNLPAVFTKYHEYLWEKYKVTHTPELVQKMWEVSKIPVTYFGSRPAICDKVSEQEDFNYIIENVGSMFKSGTFLYLHSAQMDGAMCAGTAIVKKAISEKIKCFCVSYPNVIEAKKASWAGEDDPFSERLHTTEILLLYAVGSEFMGTGYSSNQLLSLVEDRRINNRMTIVVSGLTPAEYEKRYQSRPDGVSIGFKDTKITQTLKDLRRSLEK